MFSPKSHLIQDDSEDLTEAEAQAAVPTRDVREFADHLAHLSCPTCGSTALAFRHQRRQRLPHLYTKTQTRCPQGHELTTLYQMDWMKERT